MNNKTAIIIVIILGFIAFVGLPYLRGPSDGFRECMLKDNSVLVITSDGGAICALKRSNSNAI
jgi:hypothetical protein